MAKGYRPVRRDQPFLLPPDMREWLPEDHPVWLVIRVVADHLDTSALHASRRTGGAGTAGYDPDMLAALLIWAYARGVTSSRRIEDACWSDVTFRVICAGGVPDHCTIARFRAAFPGAAQELFTQVLMLCARLGMGQLGTIALDGTKIAANASRAANRTEEHLRKLAAEAVAAHARADAADDERSGEGRRGDRVPPGGAGGGSRDERIAAALADLEAERKAAEAGRDAQAQDYLGALQAGQAPAGNVPGAAVAAAAQLRLDRAEAAQQALIQVREQRDAQARAAGHRGYRGKRPASLEACAAVRNARAALARAIARAAAAGRKAASRKGPGPARNITDPASRLMPTRNGFIQGYNAENVTSADKLIIAAELTNDTTDMAWFEPMLRQAEAAASLITACQPAPPATPPGQETGPGRENRGRGIGLMLADAGYLSGHNLTIEGPDRLIATGKHHHLEKTARAAAGASAGEDGTDGPIAAMAARLATEEGITAYRQRGHIAETPHGHIKHNMGFRQLAMRGKPKAAAEWTFTCTVHNLFKAITTGHLTSRALATLASQPA